jgi:hypothetical protein
MQSCSCYYWTVVGEPVHILHIRRAELASKLFRSFGLQACCVLGRLLMVVQLCGCLSEEQSNRLTPKTLSFAPSAQISKQAPVPSIFRTIRVSATASRHALVRPHTLELTAPQDSPSRSGSLCTNLSGLCSRNEAGDSVVAIAIPTAIH